MKLELNDRAIEKIKIADFEFTYINDNKTKSRDRIHIPFKVAKKSTLKGLNLIVHKSTSRKNFCLKYWFKGKSKVLTLGKFVPGIYGIKQVEEEFRTLKEFISWSTANEDQPFNRGGIVSLRNK